MKYDKLVRDKIPEIIRQNSGEPIYHTASQDEYWEKLKEKLLEETNEFIESEDIEEIADILEVIDAINKFKKFNSTQVAIIKEKKAKLRGKFDDRIILDGS